MKSILLFILTALLVRRNRNFFSNHINNEPERGRRSHFDIESLRRATISGDGLDRGIPLYLAPPTYQGTESRFSYKGKITACDNSPTIGRLRPTEQLQYWNVWLQAGTKVTIEINRVDCFMDPIATLFYGTADFGALRLVDWGDNENDIPRRCPIETSPNRDPKLVVNQIPYTGEYTLQVYQNGDNTEEVSKYKIKVHSRDFDGDGVGESCDRCPLTNLDTNVTLLSCETDIKDRLVTDHGCSLNDVMLKHLRDCSSRANKKGGPKKRRKAVFRNCMLRRMSVYLNGTDLDSVMSCVGKINDKAIRRTCGNRFLGTDQQSLYMLDPATGNKQFLGKLGTSPRCTKEIEYDFAKDILWGEKCDNSQDLYSADPSNGKPTGVVRHEVGEMTGMEMVGSTLYGAFVPQDPKPDNPYDGHPFSTLVIVNTTSGNFTRVGRTGFGPISGLAYDLTEDVMWGVTDGPGFDSPSMLVTIDLSTGNVTAQMPVVDKAGRNLSEIKSLEFGPDKELYGGVDQYARLKPRNLIKISTSTGLATKVRDTGINLFGLTCFTI